MASNNEEDLEREERLKSALWYSIGQFVDAEGAEDFNTTPQFIGALTELVYNQIATSARDLEVFSTHARRKVITADDVMLLARRNEALEGILKQELEGMRAAEGRAGAAGEGASAARKRGRPAGTGKGKGGE